MKKSSQKKFIYFRYIFPIVMVFVLLALMLVPCYRYITADSGAKQAISLSQLLENSWNTAKQYLFGNGEKNEVTSGFAKTLMAIIVSLWVLFLSGAASAVYAAVSAFSYFKSGCKESKQRILFVTLTFNRVVLCIYHALMLPIFFLPMIMPTLYNNLLNYYVELDTTPFDIIFVAIAVFVAMTVIVAVSREMESSLEMNIFTKRFGKAQEQMPEKDKAEEPTDPYEKMQSEAKAEQMERILRLLNKQQTEEDEDKDNK